MGQECCDDLPFLSSENFCQKWRGGEDLFVELEESIENGYVGSMAAGISQPPLPLGWPL